MIGISQIKENFKALSDSNMPVVCYRMPGESSIDLKGTEDKNASSFVFHPFVKSEKSPVIHIGGSLPTPVNTRSFLSKPSHTLFAEYKEQASKMIHALNSKETALKKVVLSRSILHPKPEGFNSMEMFELLCAEYPSAFVYNLYHPLCGHWMGATPETFIKVEQGTLITMSLAGTRAKNKIEKTPWTDKEKQEQALVSSYIEELCQKLDLEIIKRVGPYDSPAGNLLHLRTDFTIDVKLHDHKVIEDFQNELHPTPAVCGYPRMDALKMILQTELHEREYYTGYLGLSCEQCIHAFVNLRCMKVHEDDLQIFVGGGLTAESAIDSEWEETEFKSQTLLSVIKKL